MAPAAFAAPVAPAARVARVAPVALGLALLLTLTAVGAARAQADHYRIRAAIDPAAERLEAEAVVRFTAREDGADRVLYLLNTGLRLEGVASTVPLLSVTRDTARRGEWRIPQRGEPVEVVFQRPLTAGETVDLTFRYAGEIVPDDWEENFIREEWVELAVYTAWFPYVPGDPSLTYALELELPPEYLLTGLGEVTGGGGRYSVVQRRPVNDIAIAASRALRRDTVAAGGFRVLLSHVALDEDQRAQIATRAIDALRRFEDWFGPASARELEFLFAPRSQGGGYARPGYVVMQLDDDTDLTSASFLRYLGHEVAHLWWAAAPYDSWEDWLNESFAEYGALMLLRERLGAEAVRERVERYREAAADAPPIRGLDRGHPDAFAALYRKGPVILHALEQRLGRRRFLDLLRTVREEDVRSTDRLLEIVGRTGSPDDRAWLDAALDR